MSAPMASPFDFPGDKIVPVLAIVVDRLDSGARDPGENSAVERGRAGGCLGCFTSFEQDFGAAVDPGMA